MYVIGLNETREILAVFKYRKTAVEFVGKLEGTEDGLYFLEGPFPDVIFPKGILALK